MCYLFPNHKKYQQGVAIIMALFIMALVAGLAYAMMARLSRDTYRAQLILNNTQAELYAQGALLWAKDQLQKNWQTRQAEHSVDVTPIHSPVDDMQGYTIKSIIYDMQGRFNLNSLVNAEAQTDFQRLLMTVIPEISADRAQSIVQRTVEWVTPGIRQSLQDTAAHRAMTSVGELRFVKGMTANWYAKLSPYLAAFPEVSTPINVQSAPAPVLMLLGPKMTLEVARALEVYRQATPFITIERFLNADIVKNHNIPNQKATVISHYFLLETQVDVEKQRVVLYTLLQREIKKNKAVIHILWQSKNR